MLKKAVDFVKTKRVLLIAIAIAIVLAVFGFALYKNRSGSTDDARSELVELRTKSDSLAREDNYNQAAEVLTDVYEKESLKANKAATALTIGKLYQYSQDYNNAKQWMSTSLRLYQELKDTQHEAEVKDAIANVDYLSNIKPVSTPGELDNGTPDAAL